VYNAQIADKLWPTPEKGYHDKGILRTLPSSSAHSLMPLLTTGALTDHVWLGAFFTPSKKSRAAGHEYLNRFRLRTAGRDPEVNEKVAPAQLEALGKWGAPREQPYEYLKQISQPTLVVNGQQRCAHPFDEFLHPAAEYPRRPVDPVPGLQLRFAVSVSELFVRHVSLFLLNKTGPRE
jgi:hypothetical protein